MILRRLFPNKVNQTCLISALQSTPSTNYQFPITHNNGGLIASRNSHNFLSPSGSLFSQQLRSVSSSIEVSWDQKSSYSWFLPVQTRWKDNDQYLHVNNSVYHAMFDSVINVYLIRNLGLDTLSTTTPRGYMVTNSCTFHGSAAYPDVYMAGLSVAKLGNSSVKYKLGLFPLTDPTESLYVDMVRGHTCTDPVLDMVEEKALVVGEYVHVFVDPETEKSTPISKDWREGLSKLMG